MQAEKLTWSAEQNDDRMALHLAGALIRESLFVLWQAWQRKQQDLAAFASKQIAQQNIVFDLAQISKIDSAGFALLCEMLEDCQRMQSENKSLKLENIPPQLLTLADLFGLEKWIKSFL